MCEGRKKFVSNNREAKNAYDWTKQFHSIMCRREKKKKRKNGWHLCMLKSGIISYALVIAGCKKRTVVKPYGSKVNGLISVTTAVNFQ